MFASEKWYNIELAWYEWEGFREALKKEAEEIVGETWIEPTYSAYDCTGRPFSVSMDFYDVPGGTWIYHFVGYDV